MIWQFECEEMNRKTKLSKHFSKMLESNINSIFHKCYALVRISAFSTFTTRSKVKQIIKMCRTSINRFYFIKNVPLIINILQISIILQNNYNFDKNRNCND